MTRPEVRLLLAVLLGFVGSASERTKVFASSFPLSVRQSMGIYRVTIFRIDFYELQEGIFPTDFNKLLCRFYPRFLDFFFSGGA